MDYTAPLHYHYRPAHGWMNDPNGLVYFRGWYHLFYQHAPHYEKPWQEPMHWGHCRTRDFLHFEELPVALQPDMPYDKDGCWSGTAIVKDDTLYLFYASIAKRPDGTTASTVSMAFSTDGVTFTKCAENPIIQHYPADGGPDFRDPAAAIRDGKCYLVMATGHIPTRTGRLLLYESTNLVHWDYKSILASWEHKIYTECPSFLMDEGDKAIVTCSVCAKDSHAFSVQYGTFDGKQFTCQTESEIDRGPDQYAGQAFTDGAGRHLLMSWIAGWEYSTFAETSIGCLSEPRELTCRDGVLRAYPVKELQPFLKASDPAVQRTETGFVIPRTGREPVVVEEPFETMEILRDEYVVEVFLDGGRAIYTAIL